MMPNSKEDTMKLTQTQKQLIQNELNAVDLEEIYSDALDDIYGVIEIAGIRGYLTSRVLKEIDPTAFRVGMADYIDSLEQDGVLVEIDGLHYHGHEVENELDSIQLEEAQ